MNRLVLERVGVLCAALALAAFLVPGSGQARTNNVSIKPLARASAQPRLGDYAGTTSEQEAVTFKVTHHGKRLTRFTTVDGYNNMCHYTGEPPHLFHYTVNVPSMKIKRGGSFTAAVKSTLVPGPGGLSGYFRVRGRFSSGVARGTVTRMGARWTCGLGASNPRESDYLETFTAALVPASGQARANKVSCGATITADTTLHSDLVNCPSNGLVIGADNITLDLNGHTIGGDGVPAGACFDEGICDVGISNEAGHVGVTIKGGAVRGFDEGLFVRGNENRIQGLASANNSTFGIILGDSNGSRIDHNSSADDGVSGIYLGNAQQTLVSDNSVTGTTGYAMYVDSSSHNRIEQNVLAGDQHGILVGGGSDDNEVRGNRISRGGSIEIDQNSDNRVEENVLHNPGDGILLIESQRTLVSDNSVTDAGLGFPDAGGNGIFLDGADDSLVQRNVFTGGKGPAIFVTSLESQGTSDRNVISHNVANSRFSDGILVNGGATATLLEGNTANGNGHDGIEVDEAGTTLTRNTANFNDLLGIEAVPGVIDGGGNRASGNGNPLQCTNVTCS